MTSDSGTLRAPAWFRYGVIALAAIVMCSCRSAEPRYRVADVQQGDSVTAAVAAMTAEPAPPAEVQPRPQTVARPPSIIRQAAAEAPTHLTESQLAQAQSLPEGNWQSACSGGACGCGDHGPIRGPNDEYLCDGGDFGLPVGVRADWTIDGLEQEDTVAHYDTIDGRTVVTPSNKLCIYAPRFAAVRRVTDLRAYARVDALVDATQKISPIKIDERQEAATSLAEIEPKTEREKAPPSLLRERRQAGELDRDRRVAVTLGALQPYCNVQLIRTGEIIGEDRVKIARASLAAITWAGDQAAQVIIDKRRAQAEVGVLTPGTIYQLAEPNNPKLRLVKLASTGAALPGEEVEFTLRFDNVGDRVIGNVTIVDNLTNRLEYVPESQKSSLEASFSTQANDGGSLVLRWEIVEPLQPGDGGVLRFRCKVR